MAAIASTPDRTEDASADDVKVERIDFRLDADLFPIPGDWNKDEDGEYQGPLLTSAEVPESYDPKVHKPLRRTDFKEEHMFLDFRANEYEVRAKKFREEAEIARKLGNASDRSKAKKLQTMQARMAELARELAADGTVDLASILGAEQAAALLGTQN